MSTISSVGAAPYTPPVSTPSTPPSASSAAEPAVSQQDKVELSLAGRIALNVHYGRLTSDQGQQLYSQLQTINQQIQGGTADVSQLQGQLSQQIYGDTHNGATIPAGTTVSPSVARDLEQAGRVVAQEHAGNLTSSQADQFLSQIGQIYEQSKNGAAPSATNQAQNQLSLEIYDEAHKIADVPTAS
jgi:hypothetical protein